MLIEQGCYDTPDAYYEFMFSVGEPIVNTHLVCLVAFEMLRATGGLMTFSECFVVVPSDPGEFRSKNKKNRPKPLSSFRETRRPGERAKHVAET